MTAPIFDSYSNWLKAKSYSGATIRNYLVDLRKYFLFSSAPVETFSGTSLPENDLQITDKIFNQNNLSSYFQTINQDQNYKRFLASLSKFFQFALDQKLISQNPFPQALKCTGVPQLRDALSIESLISLYQQQLIAKKSSPSTIRNYINDIHQFINWAQNPSPTPSLDKAGANRGFK